MRFTVALVVSLPAWGWLAAPASAHPLGNFTINTASRVTVGRDSTVVRFLVDMAEIPALQTTARVDADGNGSFEAEERSAYAGDACAAHRAELDLAFDGRPAALDLVSSDVSFPPGQAGLPTLRLECSYRAPEPLQSRRRVSFASRAYDDRVGWREITVLGDRVTIATPGLRRASPSADLTRYPEDPLRPPLRETSVAFDAVPGGARAAAAEPVVGDSVLPRGLDAATGAFSSFVGRRDLTVPVAALAFALALLLGAVHALAPGHGKTVMAAYLVGQRGSVRQAAVIGLTVTATHTLGVLALGIAIAGSQVVTPERLYPYLGALSGLLLAAIGLNLLRNALRSRSGASGRPTGGPPTEGHHHHDHPAVHDHDHAPPAVVGAEVRSGGARVAVLDAPPAPPPERVDEGGWHAHGGRLHRHAPIVEGQPLTWSSLLALGFVGGLLPSPSAVVVLLGAIALGRAWFGVLLVIAYGAGMAATLMAAGLLLVRARGALETRLAGFLDRGGSRILDTVLPYGTALVIVVVGLVLAVGGILDIPT